MVRLSAHSLCADAMLCSSALLSSAKVAAWSDFRSFRDRRVSTSGRNLAVQCNLETKLDDTGVCRRKDIGLRCSRVAAAAAAAEASPASSVADLEKRFGQAGVKFVESAGYRILEMRLNEGSSVRVVLQSALVASYKSRMWHGGVEEILHTVVVPGVDESQRPTMVGGVVLRVWEAGGDRGSNLAATDCWEVEDVRSEPTDFVQVTLSTTSKGACTNGANLAGYILNFKYIITLTEATVSCAVITTNVGDSAIGLHGSLQTSVAVNTIDGVYALGLQGCKVLSTTPPNLTPGLLSLNGESSSGYDTKEGVFSIFKGFLSIGNDNKRIESSIESKEGLTVEKEDMVKLNGGFDRFYPVSPDSVSLLDRGKRRTINFHNLGYDDIRLSNPGEESGLEDWDSIVSLEIARSRRPVHLQAGREWRAAQQIENPSK